MAAILNFKMAANVQIYNNARVDFLFHWVETYYMPKGRTSTLFRMPFAPSHLPKLEVSIMLGYQNKFYYDKLCCPIIINSVRVF